MEKLKLKDKVERGQLVKDMTLTQGWKILKEKIENNILFKYNKILNCDFKEIIKTRTEILTLKTVLDTVNTIIQEGRRAQKELDERSM